MQGEALATSSVPAVQPDAGGASVTSPDLKMPAASKLPDMGETPALGSPAQIRTKRDTVCTRCHDENSATPVLSLYQTAHGVKADPRTPACQSCHGESLKHLAGDSGASKRPAPDVVFKKGAYPASDAHLRSEQCETCHKGGNRTHWLGSQHESNQIACNDCHTNHSPVDKVRDRKLQPGVCFTCHKEQQADTHKISTHPIDAGKMACSDCHNPHGSAGPKLLKKNTVVETCYTCHAEKRGPFLFEHQPVTEDCTNCHTPHGSNISPLLKTRPPFMCQECHDGTHASGTPVGPNAGGNQAGLTSNPSANNVGAGCLNCHRQIHGSNSPAGGYLQR